MRVQPHRPVMIQHLGLNIGQVSATINLGSLIPPGAQVRGFGGIMKTAGAGTGTLTVKLQKRGGSVDLSETIVIDADAVAETDLGFANGVGNTSTIPVATELDVVETGTVSGDVTVDLYILLEL